jgi:Raf kinase inhibitor-like YbhB/YbcL family protein/uncharacterized protein (TIGR00297 family)
MSNILAQPVLFSSAIPWWQFPLGLVLAVAIAVAAFLAKSLSRSGAAAAAGLGTIIFGLGGLPWAVLLLAFFITSSGLSNLTGKRKAAISQKYSKGARRDAWQVLANGGVAGLMVLIHFFIRLNHPDARAAAWMWLAFAASLGAANADTWATELGAFSRSKPVLITTWRQVERGTSGAISLLGSAAGVAGALLIVGLAIVLDVDQVASLSHKGGSLMLLMLEGAVIGLLLDSILGATVQAMYTCLTCRKETEKYPLHTCGSPTILKRGWGWLNNDWVNVACTASAALIVLVAGLIRPTWVGQQPVGILVEPGVVIEKMTVTSSAFRSGKVIPKDYACEPNPNHSPDLSWAAPPTGTQSLAILVEDPDALFGTFTHWVVYNLPPSARSIPANLERGAVIHETGIQGVNDFHLSGYDGPCPPAGQNHHYYLRVYALDLPPDLAARLTGAELHKEMTGHILGIGEWMGTYPH